MQYLYLYHSEGSIPKVGINAIKILNKVGFIRIASELKLVPLLNERLNSMSEEIKPIEKAMIYKNILNDIVIEEGYPLERTAKKMYGQLDFGNKPLVVFAADKSMQKLPGWEASQDSLLDLSQWGSHPLYDTPLAWRTLRPFVCLR